MFTDCYCTQFRRSTNALTRLYDEELRPIGLKITQFSLLRALQRLGEATLSEVASESELDKTTISRNIKVLVDAGWIALRSTDDGRVKVASLSKAGRDLLKAAEPHWRRAQRRVEARVRKYVNGPPEQLLLDALQTLQRASSE